MAELNSVTTFTRRLVLLGTFAIAAALHAENFRTHRAKIIELEDYFDRKTEQASVNDSIAIMLPKDQTFIQGIEINIKIPKVVAEWRDSVAWSLYSSISPKPETSIIDYSGNRAETGTFDSLSLTLLVPLEKNNTIKKDAYSHLADFIAQKSSGFVFLRFQLVMKGVSDELMNARLSVSAKPILIDKGFISVKATGPAGKEPDSYSVFVDGKQVDTESITGKGLLSDTGDHNISIVSDSYRNEVRTVTVEQAKTTEVKLSFRDIKPMIRLVAPENTKIYFDDTEYKAPVEAFHTTQGDHTVKFIVGDYEIVRSVTVSNGRSYNIAINLEAQVNEVED